MIVESDGEWDSHEYNGYELYKEPSRGYDWKDYCQLSDDGMSVLECHMCDIRKTGCMSPSHPRYFCKRFKKDKQTSLMDW